MEIELWAMKICNSLSIFQVQKGKQTTYPSNGTKYQLSLIRCGVQGREMTPNLDTVRYLGLEGKKKGAYTYE